MNKCAFCHQTDKVTDVYCRSICYACDNKLRGRPSTENHHILSKRVSNQTIEIPANWHREIHKQEKYFPPEIKNTSLDQSLVFIARLLYQLSELLPVILKACADFLLELDQRLRESHGPSYSRHLEFPSLDGVFK